MKKFLYTLAFASLATASASITLSSCDVVKSAVPDQTIPYDGAAADMIIPATSDTSAQGTIASATFQYDLDSLIMNKTHDAMGADNIKSVKITSITLSLSDGDDANNFANFKYAGFTFNTNVNPSNGPYDVAYIEDNPDQYKTTLSLPLLAADKDVRQYFGNEVEFTYLMIAKLRRPTTKELHCHIDIKYDIEVGLGS